MGEERQEQGIFSVEVILRGFATQEETLSTADILHFLSKGNPEEFDGESIEKLLSIFPYDKKTKKAKFAKEEERYRALNADQVSELTRAQRFLYDLYLLGKPLERLLVLQAQVILMEYIPIIANYLQTIKMCMKSFHENHHLKNFLESVIVASNYLTEQPVPATSMDMASLAKLKNIKTADRKKTLLHVIIEAIQHSNPMVLEFPDKFLYLEEACESFPCAYEFSSTCKKELICLKENIEVLGLSSTRGPILARFQEEFKKTAVVMEEILTSMEYFGYSQARTAPGEFFSFWIEFVSTFKISLKWLQDNKLVEKQRRRRDAQRMRDNLIQGLALSANDGDAADLVDLDAASFRNGIMNLVESSDLHIKLRQCSDAKPRKIVKRRRRKRNNEAYQEYKKIDNIELAKALKEMGEKEMGKIEMGEKEMGKKEMGEKEMGKIETDKEMGENDVQLQ